MDEKRSRSRSHSRSQSRNTMPSRSGRLRTLLLVLFLGAIAYINFSLSLLDVRRRAIYLATGRDVATKGRLVPLEAHIISKCPDTRDAMRQLILPVMQRVHDKVDFKLNYIGTPTNDGVECKHGPSECLGNIVELCARELYPDPKINLGFIMCLTKYYEHIPERSLIEDCALEHAIDFQALNECATRDDGEHGLELLRTSVQRTADAGVTISCTIRLDNEIYCIRDGGEWIDCPHGSGVNDLVIAIEKLYHSS
ncbi:hypothetical protein TOPH_02311 [Tolypocladium ophioglossoides CBS 100239]|uniref:Gamma interferon inducible lysosomal thiol reductase GILT n=1 Tax=Tolypocladium ophioglossoides (strain CBS 100239) TaxID=1163406 RepID=A0A0L0NG51_TOLOC|nr:hypothetical protein TOPH_02311 [Tolypocladium ophioglossoides CBS 100239]